MSVAEGFVVAMIVAIMAVAVGGMFGACDDKAASRHALESQGFSMIYVNDHAYFKCGHGDFSALNFEARNVKGDKVNGVVCCGLTKACTIRF